MFEISVGVRAPSVDGVARALVAVKRQLPRGDDVDVRLQVYEDGQWAIRWGSSDYDLDHRGHWGASSLDRRTNCRDLAVELLDQVAESVAVSE
jgi:hypothetical protein